MTEKEKRGSLYLLTGLIIGLALGLLISLWILPVRYTNTEPATLRTDQREVYRSLVARAFLAEADTRRAKTRLDLLNDSAPLEELITQAQTELATSENQPSARAMALLAASLSQPGLMITPLPAAVTPAASSTMTLAATRTSGPATATHSPTATPLKSTATPKSTAPVRPTVTPQPTQGSPYQLISQEELCGSPTAAPLMQIYVQDAQQKPVAGVKIEITLADAAPAYFYTGLYPEISSGYADYLMTKDTLYNLRVGDGGQLVTGLQAPVCSADGNSFSGGLKLVFQQP